MITGRTFCTIVSILRLYTSSMCPKSLDTLSGFLALSKNSSSNPGSIDSDLMTYSENSS
ncbi:hypothetical protein EVA_14753 [gut metagenome]|uniref:Uncharacterized protein n=1 Tax=gut metagenome TaxID=749906 RepID=J9G5R8_9ZZZZ